MRQRMVVQKTIEDVLTNAISHPKFGHMIKSGTTWYIPGGMLVVQKKLIAMLPWYQKKRITAFTRHYSRKIDRRGWLEDNQKAFGERLWPMEQMRTGGGLWGFDLVLSSGVNGGDYYTYFLGHNDVLISRKNGDTLKRLEAITRADIHMRKSLRELRDNLDSVISDQEISLSGGNEYLRSLNMHLKEVGLRDKKITDMRNKMKEAA